MEKIMRDVWVFDINYRVYQKDENGRSYGSPIWREHWRKQKILGDTKRSWITYGGAKIPKKGGKGIAFSEEEIDRAAYVYDHKYKIAESVKAIGDFDMLKKIADLIGYRG